MLLISIKELPKKEQHSHAHKLLGECLKSRDIEYSEHTQVKKNRYGKPRLAEFPELHYNLSHANGIAACILSKAECGIDAEAVRKYRPNVVKRAFSDAEKLLLEGADESERDLLFFRIWTLKEAYVKALGIGISYPLNTISFSFSSGRIITNISDCKFRQYILKNGKFVVSVCEKQSSAGNFSKPLEIVSER